MLDALDHAILEIVRQDNRITYEALGERVGLSPSSCRRRLAALRKSGVIIADVSVVDPRKVGLAVTLHGLVTLERDATEAHRAFREVVARTPEIVACIYVTGPADYLITAQVVSMARYEELTDWIINSSPVKRIQTMVEMRTIKRS